MRHRAIPADRVRLPVGGLRREGSQGLPPDGLAYALRDLEAAWRATSDPWSATGARLADMHRTVARARRAGASWRQASERAGCTSDQMRAYLELTRQAVAGRDGLDRHVRLLWPTNSPRQKARYSLQA